jgi:hypothetical protein
MARVLSRDRSSNRGYAFVNFTTADAARGFHYALHRCSWKPVVRGRKTINIAAAHIQVQPRCYTRSIHHLAAARTLGSILCALLSGAGINRVR